MIFADNQAIVSIWLVIGQIKIKIRLELLTTPYLDIFIVFPSIAFDNFIIVRECV